MRYREDFDVLKRRYDAFWAGEELERCLIAVTAPKEGADRALPPPRNLQEKWMDADRTVKNFERYAGGTYFGGEAFPSFFVNTGPGVLSEFMGGGYELSEDSIWFDRNPVLKSYEEMPSLALDRDTDLFKLTESLTQKAISAGFLASITDLGGPLDIAASLRGTENFLIDFYEYPDELKALIRTIDGRWIEAAKYFFSKYESLQDGYGSWMPLWCRERWSPIQCDISVMLSCEMFEEFAFPSLERISSCLDKVVYHLDGPQEIKHLDCLLGMSKLDAVECVPLPKSNRHLRVLDGEWIDAYKRIQAAGKGLIIRCVDPLDLEPLLLELSHKSLFVALEAGSPEEADSLLKQATEWAKLGRKGFKADR